MTKIAVDILCKNEEDYIEYCIKSILPYIDMIFITDTGSTDNTINIIKTLYNQNPDKIKILRTEWNNNYSDAHNFVLKQMGNDYDYYLRVDADEIFFHSTLSTLKEQLEKCPEQISWQMPYLNFHGGHKCFDKKDKKPNICKLKGHDVKYVGKVHEFIHINNDHIMKYATKDLDGEFFCHYSWCYMKRRYLKKLERIKSEDVIDSYNNTPTQIEAIIKFYKQFKDEPYFEVKGDYKGTYPEVLKNSWMLEDKEYSVDNSMDSKCVCSDEFCEHQCIIDRWEVSCSNFNHRKENCL